MPFMSKGKAVAVVPFEIVNSIIAEAFNGLTSIGALISMDTRLNSEREAAEGQQEEEKTLLGHIDLMQHVLAHEVVRVLEYDHRKYAHAAFLLNNLASTFADPDRHTVLKSNLDAMIHATADMEKRLNWIKTVLMNIQRSAARLEHMKNPPTRDGE